MTHSRAWHYKQWPIHQAELGESPMAWEGLLWEGWEGDLPVQRGALSPSSGRGLQEPATRLCLPSLPGHSHLMLSTAEYGHSGP